MSGEWTTWILIGLIFLMLVWNITRRRKTGNANLDVAIAVLQNVNNNLKIMESRLTNWQSKKKFQTGSWSHYKDKLTFLDTSTTDALNESFTLAEEFNSRIESAKKNNAMLLLQDMQVERLREPLTKSKEGLIAWLRTDYETEQRNRPRRGCLGL
jgi:hypothetical protein